MKLLYCPTDTVRRVTKELNTGYRGGHAKLHEYQIADRFGYHWRFYGAETELGCRVVWPLASAVVTSEHVRSLTFHRLDWEHVDERQGSYW